MNCRKHKYVDFTIIKKDSNNNDIESHEYICVKCGVENKN